MKKKNLLLLSAVSLLALVGCGGGNSNSVSQHPSNDSQNTVLPSESTTNSTTINNSSTGGGTTASVPSNIITEWSAQDIADMQQAIGKVLPVAPLTTSYVNESYVDPSDDSFTFYVFDEEVGNIVASYGEKLLAAGFLYEGVDNPYGYDMHFYYIDEGTDSYLVQIDYYPGDSEFNPCFEIYAWTYSENGGGETPNPDLEWPASDVADFLGDSTTTIPEYQADNYYADVIEGDLQIYSVVETQLEDSYRTTLEAAGWTIDDSQYDEVGYIATSPDADVELIFFDINQDGYDLFVIIISKKAGGGDIGGGDQDGELIGTYSFASLTVTSGQELKTNAQTVLGGLGSGITWTNGNKVYNGAGSGGAFANQAGLLKFGSSSAQGVLTFIVSENVSKIVLECHSFYTSGDPASSNKGPNYVSVNDMTPIEAPYTEDGTPGEVVFTLDSPTKNISVKSCDAAGTGAGRIYLFSISLYR